MVAQNSDSAARPILRVYGDIHPGNDEPTVTKPTALTQMQILFGNGSVAQVVLSEEQKGSYQSICWGWGLGVMLGVYTAGISGGHINPAVTFANCIFRKFP